jgi:predicted DNA-binding WGR domain protein
VLTIHRRNPARIEARFYAVARQAGLLAGWTVVRKWGRIGCAGRVRADVYGDLAPAKDAAERSAAWKGGYR